MSYTKITDYAAKDALLAGNPAKYVKGTELGAEFDAIQTADALNLKTATAIATYAPLGGSGASGTWPIGVSGNAATATTAGNLTGNPAISVSSINGGQLAGMRNKIINGKMVIAQRGTAATTNVTGQPYYCVDRFFGSTVASGASVSFSQANDGGVSISGPYHLFLQTITTKASLAAGDFSFISQKIEGSNISDLKWGTASAKTITLSFRARADNIGASAVISVSLRNSASNRCYVAPVTITNASASYSIIIPGDTSGTWLADSGTGIEVAFTLACGTLYTTSTVNAWQAGNFISGSTQTNMLATPSAALSFTDVQLEVGAVATPFEHRPYGMELGLCQRYYQIFNMSLSGYTGSGTANQYYMPLPVVMRSTPTINVTGSTNINTTGAGCANVGNYALSFASYGVGLGGFISDATGNLSSEL